MSQATSPKPPARRIRVADPLRELAQAILDGRVTVTGTRDGYNTTYQVTVTPDPDQP